MVRDQHITRVADALGENISSRRLLLRGKRPLIALPLSREAALRTLQLYRPQRFMGILAAKSLRRGSFFGLHRVFLPRCGSQRVTGGLLELLPAGANRDSLGILFGSAEHRIFRAVLSYRNGDRWEVAKLATGPNGSAMLIQEANAMRTIGEVVPEVPEVLGLENNEAARLLRMPYLIGTALAPGETSPVKILLESWLSDDPPQPLPAFPEWSAIETALRAMPTPETTLDRLSQLEIRRSIRHGDLARWNLLRTRGGQIKVLDWEWGEMSGLAGLDLVHYLAQDFRLVRRMPPGKVVAETVHALESPFWSGYLERAGWAGYARELVMACLAFKQGAGHQDNAEILKYQW